MKTILVTGSAGFLYSNFVRHVIFNYDQCRIVGIDNLSDRSSFSNVYVNRNVKFYLGNVADADFIQKVFEIEKPSIVIHGAEEKLDPNKMIRTNVEGTRILLEASKKYGANHFLYSTAAYPDINGQTYKTSKEAGSMFVESYNGSFSTTLLYFGEVYGPRQNVSEHIPKLIINKEFTGSVGTNNYIYVDDAIESIMDIVNNRSDGKKYIYGKENITSDQVSSTLHEISNKDFLANIQYSWSIDTDLILDTATSFKDGLLTTYYWYINNSWFYK